MGKEDLFHKKKIRKAKDLQRRAAIKDPYETVLIICEDSKSVPYYFKECIKLFRLSAANVIVIPSQGSAPISVVDHAIQQGKAILGIDRIFCVFDQDSHESFDRAINKMDAHIKQSDKSKPEYMIVKSIPCFEIWLLLHFEYSTKPYNAKQKKSAAEYVIHELRKFIAEYSKSRVNWFAKIENRIGAAIKNAKQLDDYHGADKFPNPSTNMHEIIEYLMHLKDGC